MTAVASDYSVALIALLLFVLLVLFQSALVGAAKAEAKLPPGSEPLADYGNPVYRLNRSHQNGVEIMPAAGIALAAGIFAEISPGVANWSMVVFLISQVMYVVVYAKQLGKKVQGLRTFVFVTGWAMVVLVCVLATGRLL
ncbi:MAPEG family protein [Pseudophaeobacter sp.]|uniref:MAPEG family protein n=1 Tax=Pseudophaeobacter sp. TaxID=1971739 RepID=UPI003297C18B